MAPTLSSSSSSFSISLLSHSLLFFSSHFSPLLIFFSYISLSIPLPSCSHLLTISPQMLHMSISLISVSYCPLYCPQPSPTSLSLYHSFLLSLCLILSPSPSLFLSYLTFSCFSISSSYFHPYILTHSPVMPPLFFLFVACLPSLAPPSTWNKLAGHVKLRSKDQP